ncbi:helix-turn-helix domain-containing protein [Amycolatopsis sp. CA-230715]|uniref:helix-turn-helix domain-containing protein n=1 Tax=Amycolatopsis sp. CA-230715 TaxID=2745196 RepID=UPI001C01A8F8|nr:helix-turn-helix transcriptional regulator [Amycolatopsis sp. CA-230715]QWF80815.1 hypothetical protein HUW46_04239 [Amycolatopsis sp. CA-230715]
MGRKRTPRPYSVKAREVGSELRKHRESADLSLRELAQKLGWSHASLSFIENGARPPSATDVARYLGGCGPVDQVDYEWLVKLAAEPDGPGLVRSHEPNLSTELRSLIVQESSATAITAYEPDVLEGLLQSENYAQELLHWGGMLTPDAIELRVKARMARQRLLHRRLPPQCTFFQQERALRAVIGDNQVMNEQILYLMLTGAQRHCVVRIVPDSAGPFSAWQAFRVMDYDRFPSVVYTEGMTSGTFLEGPHDVVTHRSMLDKLDNAALDEGQSRAWLVDLAAAYDRAEAAPPCPPRIAPD